MKKCTCDKQDKLKKKSHWHLFLLVGLGIIGAVIMAYIFFLALMSHGLSPADIWPIGDRPQPPSDYNKFGVFGDFIGGSLNPILTFLTFLAVLITINLQLRELQATRDEIEMTREATQDSAKALKEQRSSLERQNFENTFFQMMRLLNDVIEGASIKQGGGVSSDDVYMLEGRAAYNYIVENSRYSIISANTPEKCIFDQIIWHKDILHHYFRTIFNIIKYIEDEELPYKSPIRKKRYIRILRSQLSEAELVLLYFNCLTETGKEMKKYAQWHALFDNLDAESALIKHSTQIATFDRSAFGTNQELLALHEKHSNS